MRIRDDKNPRCPGCKGKVLDQFDHIDCLTERDKAQYDETDHDDYPEPRERIA